MIFCKLLFALLASSAIFAVPIPNENPSVTLEKRVNRQPQQPLQLGAFLNQFPLPPAGPMPTGPMQPHPASYVPAPISGEPARPIPTRRHTA
ncbi:hypothetical protein M408DRAFT_334220 [Serendipita vermifera MAFF 305830]|uniref:Uncharacterized protein n=1 Tax=Serendipita vermifera MAFF 305830 TaxID=933852 RepID=A0A0C2WQJ6_SERVB|nr:hypothetical protein M408DRAFT_334220 [Serendipita vermifera MAFF 305830]